MITLKYSHLSHRGKVRKNNEDSFAVFDVPLGKLFIVCDGMGGHNSGEIASQKAIEEIHKVFLEQTENMEPVQVISNALDAANDAIYQQGQANPEQTGMGTTVVLLLISEETYFLGHVGDSRIYRISDGSIERATKDHSYVQKLVDDRIISPAEARSHPENNKILFYLGQGREMQHSVQGPFPLRGNELFVLCSDGLSDLLEDDEILINTQSRQPKTACVKLQNLALQRGGYDNITIQIVKTGVPISTKRNILHADYENRKESARVHLLRNRLITLSIFVATVVIAGILWLWTQTDLFHEDKKKGLVTRVNETVAEQTYDKLKAKKITAQEEIMNMRLPREGKEKVLNQLRKAATEQEIDDIFRILKKKTR